MTGNINERTWNTQRKALYARMSQAIALMPALNGFGTVRAESGSSGTSSYVAAEDTAAETFIASGLSKVLKINNVCDNEHLADCGIPTSYTDMAGTQKTMPTTLYGLNAFFSSVSFIDGSSYSTKDTKAVAFETQNGESIVAFYNQACRTEYLSEESLSIYGDAYGFPEATMCLNLIYDLNGNKGPNSVGKDIGVITVFNSMDSNVVAPMPSSPNNAGGSSATYVYTDAIRACTDVDSDSRIPNVDELSALLINKDVFNVSSGAYWTSSVFRANKRWYISTAGQRSSADSTQLFKVRCIKR